MQARALTYSNLQASAAEHMSLLAADHNMSQSLSSAHFSLDQVEVQV